MEPKFAYGYCEGHLRERRPAEWAKRRADGQRRPRDGRPRAKRLIGCTAPRLFTPPLRRLTRKTTRGFEVVDFARDVLGEPLLPWQEWLVVHALELLPDGTFRFRTVLALVARQNGKTHLSKTLALWRLYVDGARLVLGAAQDLSIAREVLEAANETIDAVPELAEEKDQYLTANGKEGLRLFGGGRYLIKASTRSAGRGLSVDHLTMDEVREQRDWAAWSALSKTTTARASGQIWCLSNAGDEQSVVLNHLRSAAGVQLGSDGVSLMGEARDASIFLAEWSAAEGCELDDERAWAQANPALGHTVSVAAIRSALGTDPPEVFRTEVLCQKVDQLNGAIDLAGWKAGGDPVGTMDGLRDRVIACVDVAPDGGHVTLTAAAETPDGRYRVEPVAAWNDTDTARTELGELLARVAPAAVAWFPSGPAAALAPELRALGAVEIKGAEANEACQGFADLVAARRILHPEDPLLDAHIAGAQKYQVGDGWRFVRRGAGHVDAAYSAAGAVHVLRTLPVEKPLPKPMVV
ncbi:phage terminase [Prauserella shujinwangii]|uniref:Phage terminase n=1 Tax=Prauserella shujinwangii TaxID=1453103 RepID=A0A2T0LXC1_9PSEU|nr:terminase large subunit [Prauserella shujinwangii]PRX48674.1 phage terminase [Prauserella shujinwangii]